jgi:hypothetical protein
LSQNSRLVNEGIVAILQTAIYLTNIQLNHCHQVNDDTIVWLNNTFQLEHLAVNGTRASLRSLHALTKTHTLKSLQLGSSQSPWTPASTAPQLGQVQWTSMQALDLSSFAEVSDTFLLPILEQCPQLRSLNLSMTSISNAALNAIPFLLPELTSLTIPQCIFIELSAEEDPLHTLILRSKKLSFLDCSMIASVPKQPWSAYARKHLLPRSRAAEIFRRRYEFGPVELDAIRNIP